MNANKPKRSRGIILLVVLGMLALFSILVVSYIAFSSRARRSSFGIASREFRQPDVNQFMDDAMMLLVRGTSDTSSPFYGEDLLSDFYGTKGGLDINVVSPSKLLREDGMTAFPERRAIHLGDGIVRLPLDLDRSVGLPRLQLRPAASLDDALAGSIVTFNAGPLTDLSFRVLRSTGARHSSAGDTLAQQTVMDSIYIELDPTRRVTLSDGTEILINTLLDNSNPFQVGVLFYERGVGWGEDNVDDDGDSATDELDEVGYPSNNSDVPYSVYFNSKPLNGQPIGYSGTASNIDQTIGVPDPFATVTPPTPPVAVLDVPVSFQPNYPATTLVPTELTPPTKGRVWARNPAADTNVTLSDNIISPGPGGDYDEPYDAADYLNYFLAQRLVLPTAGGGTETKVIPSFHRPALINYLANEHDWSDTGASGATDPVDVRATVEAIKRATFRPIPFHALQYGNAINERFTGGNTDFAFRSPNRITDNSISSIRRLDLLVNALCNGPWDVDNDGDGVEDSIWIDIGLPIFTSREGKLLRPLIATMIEDTSGKLNLNAHGNTVQDDASHRDNISSTWAGTTTTAGALEVFRGLGYGPSEISLFFNRVGGGTVPNGSPLLGDTELANLLNERYRSRTDTSAIQLPGQNAENDLFDISLRGNRPTVHAATSRDGFSVDPYGTRGVGLSRTGGLVVAGTTPNENVDDPYEFNPDSPKSADSLFKLTELESVVRNRSWDTDVLPQRLRSRMGVTLGDRSISGTIVGDPNNGSLFTTKSTSFEPPLSLAFESERTASTDPQSLFNTLLARLGSGAVATDSASIRAYDQLLHRLVSKELLRGNKMDVNRPFGNGIDDNGNGVFDEPIEFLINGTDDDADGYIDEADEFFAAYDSNANGIVDSFPATPSTVGRNVEAFPSFTSGTNYNRIPDYNMGIRDNDLSSSGRELLARHLYILAMTVSGPGFGFPVAPPGASSSGLPAPASMTPLQTQLYKAKRIAQWAINAVDFRDSDSIMTRFQYDPTPLDATGWDIVATNPVVWGLEHPDLVLTENLGLHDLRVHDTSYERGGGSGATRASDETGGGDTINDSDSVRIPQGSLFVELYCNRVRNSVGDESQQQSYPQELYTLDSGIWQLDLTREAPVATGQMTGAPVWRLGISRTHDHEAGAPAASLDPEALREMYPHRASFDPTSLVDFEATALTLPLERFVVFREYADYTELTSLAAAVPDMSVDQIFFSPTTANLDFTVNTDKLLEPGQYLNLLPRVETPFGATAYLDPVTMLPDMTPAKTLEKPTGNALQGLIGDNSFGVVQYDSTGTAVVDSSSTTVQAGLPLVISTFPNQTGWAGTSAAHENGRIGLNISEPMPNGTDGYYPVPTSQLDSSAAALFPYDDAYMDYDDTVGTSPRDRPVDLSVLNAPIRLISERLGGGATVEEPIRGTVENYRSIFLQRLADPLKPFDAVLNPYITVDWMTTDLTVFNGEERAANLGTPAVPLPYATKSRERSGKTGISTEPQELLSYESSNVRVPPPGAPVTIAAGSTSYFEFGGANPSLQTSLNFLNLPYGNRINGGPDAGAPLVPLATTPVLNRDFATSFELLIVPACSPGRLGEEFTASTAATTGYFQAAALGSPPTPAEIATFNGPFGHLLNFFQSAEAESDSSQLHRMFGFLQTAPRFNGELDLITPNRLRVTASDAGRLNPSVIAGVSEFGDGLQPPFNLFQNNKRFGKINLNTISDFQVWNGLMNNHLTNAERVAARTSLAGDMAYQVFLDSRRGYDVLQADQRISVSGTPAAPPYNYDGKLFNADAVGVFPTQFAGVFRPEANSDLAPELRGSYANALRRLSRIDGGLLRHDLNPTNAVVKPNPFFVRTDAGPAHRNRNANPFTHYQTLMRMPNLATDQSQVFVIRMTMGFFEVDSSTLSLGREYNSELAQNQRYKATFIVDRSIPVAFRPGEDRNIRDTVVFTRIEK